jgi:DNA modification methylase
MDAITIGKPRPRRSADGALRAALTADPSGLQGAIPTIPVHRTLPRNVLLEGDCLTILRTLPDESVDAVVTDPPYGLSGQPAMAEVLEHWLAGEDHRPGGRGFMGKTWDGFVPSPAVWRECYRVLKPGGHLLAFFGSRTWDLGVLAIRLAGFDIRDSIACWLYGSAMPKSLDVGKALDKMAGAERPVIGPARWSQPAKSGHHAGLADRHVKALPGGRFTPDITAPACDAAKTWDGFGTALKPSFEPVVIARKPLDGTVVANVLSHGTGALNIAACRVVGPKGAGVWGSSNAGCAPSFNASPDQRDYRSKPVEVGPAQVGRWPANVVFSHAPECAEVGAKRVKASGFDPAQRGAAVATGFGRGRPDPTGNRRSGDGDGMETVADWQCVADCPVRLLDEQSGPRGAAAPASGPTYAGPSKSTSMAGKFNGMGDRPPVFHADAGGASRFYYTSKAASGERWGIVRCACTDEILTRPEFKQRAEQVAGPSGQREWRCRACGGRAEFQPHETQKPLDLMRWLVRLVGGQPGSLILDPYSGSGTTSLAARMEGFDFLAIERDPAYARIARARLGLEPDGEKGAQVAA